MFDHDRRSARRTRAHSAPTAARRVCGMPHTGLTSSTRHIAASVAPHLIAADKSPPLGQYLRLLELVSESQLADGLAAQAERHAAGSPISLGDLLLEQGVISSQDLALALMLQQLDRVQDGPISATARVGELLVHAGVISASQCASALLAQMQLREDGIEIPLGQLLIAQGLVTAERLTMTLWEQASARRYAETVAAV